MGYCVNCGEKYSKEDLFCTRCGNPVNGQEEQNKNLEEPAHNVNKPIGTPIYQPVNEPIVEPVKTSIYHENNETRTQKGQKKRKGKNLFYIILVVLALCFGGAYYVLNNYIYNPMKQIEAMTNAYKSGNKDDLYKQFSIPEGTIANADSFMELVKEIGWEDIEKQLTKEITRYQNGKPLETIKYEDRDFIVLENNPVLFGIFDTFEFSIVPLEVEVYSPVKDVNITIDSVTITTKVDGEYQKLGKFLPGEYEYSYTYEKGYIPLKGNGTVKITPQDDEQVKIEFDAFDNWEDVDLYADIKNAVLYVNGKSIGKTVEEIETLSPIILDGSVEIYAVGKDENGKEIKSDIYKIDDKVIYLEFEEIRKQQEEIRKREEELQKQQELDVVQERIKELYQSYRAAFETANNNADFYFVSHYFADGTQLRKNYKEFVEDHRDLKGSYNYKFIDNQVTSIKALSENKFELITTEEFDFYHSLDGTTKFVREKRYLIKLVNEGIQFEEIEDLKTQQTKID